MVVGLRIKALREKKGLSQIELSKKININNSVLSRIESNDRAVRDDELIKFADFFNVSVDYLLGRTVVPNYIDTFAAHSEEELTEEAQKELETFKEFLKNKYK